MPPSPQRPTRRQQTIPQEYPRVRDPNSNQYGLFDASGVVGHPEPRRISSELLERLIVSAIEHAEQKSRRELVAITPDMDATERDERYRTLGRNLFEYFHDYPIDPAATAHEYHNRHYREVGLEVFRNRTLQKGRMNSGWRYQFLAVGCAKESGRFDEVAGFGTSQGDFTAKIRLVGRSDTLHLYVSVKNRSDTLGGQDWPSSIAALETFAKNDNNKTGPYLCVFGVVMDSGLRRVPRRRGTNQAYSENTEIWLSDFFWPFFSAYSYEEIMTAMLDVLVKTVRNDSPPPSQTDIPNEVLDYFGAECQSAGLVNDEGYSHDPFFLVRFFCGRKPGKPRRGTGKQS
jgi:hypothetical protein